MSLPGGGGGGEGVGSQQVGVQLGVSNVRTTALDDIYARSSECGWTLLKGELYWKSIFNVPARKSGGVINPLPTFINCPTLWIGHWSCVLIRSHFKRCFTGFL